MSIGNINAICSSIKNGWGFVDCTVSGDKLNCQLLPTWERVSKYALGIIFNLISTASFGLVKNKQSENIQRTILNSIKLENLDSLISQEDIKTKLCVIKKFLVSTGFFCSLSGYSLSNRRSIIFLSRIRVLERKIALGDQKNEHKGDVVGDEQKQQPQVSTQQQEIGAELKKNIDLIFSPQAAATVVSGREKKTPVRERPSFQKNFFGGFKKELKGLEDVREGLNLILSFLEQRRFLKPRQIRAIRRSIEKLANVKQKNFFVRNWNPRLAPDNSL